MMPIDADILLSVLLVGVYLVDSMHFLSIGDALVTTRGFRDVLELGRRTRPQA